MWKRPPPRPIYTHQVQEAMDDKFASMNALLDLAQKIDSLPETTAIRVQKKILEQSLQKSFEDFQRLGVSLPDLFKKFGSQLFKSQVLLAQDKIKAKEVEQGAEPLITDLINEDQISQLLENEKGQKELYEEIKIIQKEHPNLPEFDPKAYKPYLPYLQQRMAFRAKHDPMRAVFAQVGLETGKFLPGRDPFIEVLKDKGYKTALKPKSEDLSGLMFGVDPERLLKNERFRQLLKTLYRQNKNNDGDDDAGGGGDDDAGGGGDDDAGGGGDETSEVDPDESDGQSLIQSNEQLIEYFNLIQDKLKEPIYLEYTDEKGNLQKFYVGPGALDKVYVNQGLLQMLDAEEKQIRELIDLSGEEGRKFGDYFTENNMDKLQKRINQRQVIIDSIQGSTLKMKLNNEQLKKIHENSEMQLGQKEIKIPKVSMGLQINQEEEDKEREGNKEQLIINGQKINLLQVGKQKQYHYIFPKDTRKKKAVAELYQSFKQYAEKKETQQSLDEFNKFLLENNFIYYHQNKQIKIKNITEKQFQQE